MADAADWKATYLNSIREMEVEEKRWRDLEQVLRRIVNRLCLAGRGLDDALDAQLSKVTEANRRNAGAGELETLLGTLSTAVAALDSKPPPVIAKAAAAKPADVPAVPAPAAPPALDSGAGPIAPSITARVTSPAPSPEVPLAPVAPAVTSREVPAPAPPLRWSATCDAVGLLLQRLSMDDTPDPVASSLIEQLPSVTSDAALAKILTHAADVLRERAEHLARQRDEATALLAQVTTRLEEVATYLSSSSDDRRTTLGDAESLNSHVMTEVQELTRDVQVARDLAPLQRMVGARLEVLANHVKDFRAREESRFLEHSERTQKMTARVAELENQTRDLHRNLHLERSRARLDPLTGVANRISFDERLQEEIVRFARFGSPVSVLIWDIDHFKSVNDTFGHRAGDRVLREVAKCLAGRLRTTDFVARFGGEEFVMMLIGTPLAEANRVAEELRNSVASLKLHFRGSPVKVTISCGITELRAGDDADAVFDRADSALYRAKNGGRNLCVAA
jgi:diguanylate cyclase